MISDHDRSGYFGASDARFIIGNTKTKTFEDWWAVKLGVKTNTYTNEALLAGTYFEHPILEAIGCPETDKQIIIEDLLLRVNYDGTGDDEIMEVKTYKSGKIFSPPKHYIDQVNVQMFAWEQKYGVVPKASIYAYALEPEDYKNFLRPIDIARIERFPIEYDREWITSVFLPNLLPKVDALRKGVWI